MRSPSAESVSRQAEGPSAHVRGNDLNDATCRLDAGDGVGRKVLIHGLREQTVWRDKARAALRQFLAVIKHVDIRIQVGSLDSGSLRPSNQGSLNRR